MFLVVLLQVLFAFSFILFKQSLNFGTPFFLVGARMLVCGITNIAWYSIIQKKRIYFSKEIIVYLILVAVFNIFLTNGFELWGMQYITTAKASLIYNFSPFIAALFGYIFLHERMNRYKWLGIIIGLIGLLPILMNNQNSEKLLSHISFLSTAELAIIVAATATVFGWIFLKILVYKKKYPLLLSNGISMLLGGIISLSTSLIFENQTLNIFSSELIYYSLATGFLILICYNVYAYLLRMHTATFLTFAGFTMPLFTALFGWFFLSEYVNWQFFASNIAVFIGLIIYYKQEITNID